MSKNEWAAEDLLRIVKSKKRYTDTFVKKYWKHFLLDTEQGLLMKQVILVGEKVKERVHFLKWLVYLHVMMVTRCQHFQELGNLLVGLVRPEIFKKTNNTDDGFDQLLDRVAQPYLMYIQKRALKAEIIKNVPCRTTPHLKLLEISFELVNLINLGCSFCREIYKFGRYYSQQYPFLSDLNTVLGMDLRECYSTLRSCVTRLWSRFNQQPPKSQHILNALIDQINTTNQKMFIVFYNTYFYTELRNFLPNWIRYEPKDVVQNEESDEEESKQEMMETVVGIRKTDHYRSPMKRKNSRVRPNLAEVSIRELQQLMENTGTDSKNGGDCSTTAEKTPQWHEQQLEEIQISQFDKTHQHLLDGLVQQSQI